MKKRTLGRIGSILMAGAMVVSLAACGGGDASTTTTAAGGSTETTAAAAGNTDTTAAAAEGETAAADDGGQSEAPTAIMKAKTWADVPSRSASGGISLRTANTRLWKISRRPAAPTTTRRPSR